MSFHSTGSGGRRSWRDWLGPRKGDKDRGKQDYSKLEDGHGTGHEEPAQEAPKKTKSAFADMSQRQALMSCNISEQAKQCTGSCSLLMSWIVREQRVSLYHCMFLSAS